MSRDARIVVPGVYHHITQRGNNRQNVFFADGDRDIYLQFLKKECETYGLRVHGYCLMTNHIHLVAVPEKESSLASALGRTHFSYSRFINETHSRIGHLWQSRYFSCPMDEQWYLPVMRYVEMNPVRAGMVSEAWNWPWSSAAAHTGKSGDKTELLQMQEWHAMHDAPNWDNDLHLQDHEQFAETLREHTYKGRPLGDDAFKNKLETATGKRLNPRPMGRPRKEAPK